MKSLVMQGLSLEDVYCRLRTPFGQMHAVKVIYYSIKRDLARSHELNCAIEEGIITVSDDDGKSSPFA